MMSMIRCWKMKSDAEHLQVLLAVFLKKKSSIIKVPLFYSTHILGQILFHPLDV